MSETSKKTLGYIIAFLAAIFVVAELLIAAGVITPNNEAEGFLANFNYGAERAFENPTLVALLITLFMNIWGFIENTAVNPQSYYVTKFIETFALYEPLLLALTQALPMQYALALAIVIDVLRRLKTKK